MAVQLLADDVPERDFAIRRRSEVGGERSPSCEVHDENSDTSDEF